MISPFDQNVFDYKPKKREFEFFSECLINKPFIK